MATNGRGYMRPSSGGRTPPFLIVGFLVVIGILAFNYWNISSKNSMLTMTVNQLELKYRSTQANKLDVEKRNVELSAQLEEAKRYKQEAQDKDMKLREAEQKAAELNGKIDTLASDLEVAQNDLNVCEDSVGFCHQNITKMTIDHKRELEEAHMQCNRKVDEAKSLAEQRAASLESTCQQAVSEVRLTVLRKVQQVFGTKAILLLQQQADVDVSGIDLNIMTGPEQNQQLAQQNAQAQQDVRAVQQQQAPQQQYHQLEQQEREQQKQPEENQIQPQQQPAENQIQQQQQPAENQIEQQPAENQIEQQQQPVKHEPEQPQLQNNLLEYHQQQQYPNLQHVSEEHLPHLQPALPAEQGQAMTQQQKQVEPHNAAAAQQQQQAQPTAQQLPHESLQNVEQQHEKPNETMMEDKNKEVTVNPGLSQSDDLIKAAQQGYPQTKQNPEDQHQDQASDFHKPENQLSVINQAPVAQQGIDEAVRSSDSRQKIYDAQKQDAADHDHVGAQIVSQHGEPAPAPPGELIVNRQVEDGQEQHPASDQKRDQEDYVARGLDDAAPLGQAVGASIVVAAQQSLSPLSLQVLNEHYQLPSQLDSNLRSELSKAELDLKSQLAFSEEKPPISSLEKLLQAASQQKAALGESLPADNWSDVLSELNSNNIPARLHSDNLVNYNDMHDVPSVSTNQELVDKIAVDLDNTGTDKDWHGSNVNSYQYEKAVSEILDKEKLLDLPDLDSSQHTDTGHDEPAHESSHAEKPAQPVVQKTVSHGFLYLNLSQLLESSDLDDEFMEENTDNQYMGDDDDDLFLDGTTRHFDTTEDDYSTEAADWSKTTETSVDFDAVDIPQGQYDGSTNSAANDVRRQGTANFDQQLPRAVGTQLRLPVNNNNDST